MRAGSRSDLAARWLLTCGALLPYWPLLTFGVVYVTDDYFASDIFNGELPVRVLVGQMIRRWELPVWTQQLCSGAPLGGWGSDPIGLLAFTLLPPAPALDLLVIVLLLVAAHGAYGLARRFGADRTGSVLAGIAFAGSGVIACQLKHVSIVSTVVWLPVGLLLIDRALGAGDAGEQPPPTPARRALWLAAFGLVFAQQVLSGFPQSAYICALCYGAFALFRAIVDRRQVGRWPTRLKLLAGLALATALGAAAGAVVLLPLSELGSVSDRSEPLGYDWSTNVAYWPQSALTFLVPYVHGDVSDDSYQGLALFWEDYGYVGAATFLLAIYGAVRERRRPVIAFAIGMTLVAYLFVLGKATPVYRVAYDLIPGLKLFRFSTRFLIVVELGIVLLGAVGLTRLRLELARRWAEPSLIPRVIAVALCAGTALDLFIHQPRQNPMVPASEWLAPPPAVNTVRRDTPRPRTYTPRHRDLHRSSFLAAHGWTDLRPYYELRNSLEPNIGGGFWNTPSADCYAGISPRWFVNVWGDHSREQSLVAPLAGYATEGGTVLWIRPAFRTFLRTYGVTHVITPHPQAGTPFELIGHDGHAFVYKVAGSARARFVRGARHATSPESTAKRLVDASFDPDREIVLHDAPATIHPTVDELDHRPAPTTPPRAVVVFESSRDVVIDADAPEDGFLLLADTFYPGWIAKVDGVRTPVYRANETLRGIQLPKGRHEVRFRYRPQAYIRGLRISVLALVLLLLWALAAAIALRRRNTRPAAA